jgi:glycosyltransferase involved in cell wall biosynthesis
MTTKISVLICTRDRPDTIGQAVQSVADCDYPTFDLHVMDQSTTDQTRRIVESLAPRVADRCEIHYHHLDKAGLSRAYNAGMRASDGAVIACTDDDVIVPRDWLTQIAASFDGDGELGLLYGQVQVPASLAAAARSGAVIVPALGWSKRERLFHRARNFKVWGMGANMALRRELLDRVVGFDEAMGGGAPLRSSQDYDFSFRTYRAGYAVLLDPDVKVDHYGTRTPEQWPATERNYGIGDAAFYWKHIRCRDPVAIWLLARQVAYVVKQSVVGSVRQRRWIGISEYGRNLILGARLAAGYDVDRRRRLYRATDGAQLGVTEANSVTAAVRDDGRAPHGKDVRPNHR